MRVAIYQPQYFPRLHYFNRALGSELFVVLSSAQYTKRLVHEEAGRRVAHPSFQNQAPIKSASGTHLLRVPIAGSRRTAISSTSVCYSNKWRITQLRTIEHCYRRAAYFDRYFPEIEKLFDDAPASLADLDVRTFIWATTRLLGIDVPVSDLSLASLNDVLPAVGVPLKCVLSDDTLPRRPPGRGQGTQWTVAICRALGATHYVHGATARTNYMDTDAYRRAAIELIEQSWTCGEYPQLYGAFGFIPNLSVLDALCNVGPDVALDIVLGHASMQCQSSNKELT
jgi:hypothetical protein